MTQYDVFNGDADGLCALHQMRLETPCDSILITGVKRDIALLQQVEAKPGDAILVLDISMDKNRAALDDVLSQGAQVLYADHHYPGDIPEHKALNAHIDTDAETCTSLIISRLLNHAYLPWAVTAAFGDNLMATAAHAAEPLNLTPQALEQLKTLGTLLNYNGYGSSLSDLYFEPAALYRRMQPYRDPFDFIGDDEAFEVLSHGYRDDHSKACAIAAYQHNDDIALYIFPDEPFARRISGVYANELAQAFPDRAHALLSESADGSFLVSVRAPVNRRHGADELCRQFETGGGRKAAAGINCLPASELERFVSAMTQQFQR